MCFGAGGCIVVLRTAVRIGVQIVHVDISHRLTWPGARGGVSIVDASMLSLVTTVQLISFLLVVMPQGRCGIAAVVRNQHCHWTCETRIFIFWNKIIISVDVLLLMSYVVCMQLVSPCTLNFKLNSNRVAGWLLSRYHCLASFVDHNF